MATTSGPSFLQPCSYWKESSGSLRLSGGCGNWLGVSNHSPHLPKHTHTHTCTYTHNSNTYAQIMQQNTHIFDLELNVMDRILILVQTGLNFCGLVKVKLAWRGQAYWNSNYVWKRKVSIHLCFTFFLKLF